MRLLFAISSLLDVGAIAILSSLTGLSEFDLEAPQDERCHASWIHRP